MQIMCHPDNYKALKLAMEKKGIAVSGGSLSGNDALSPFAVFSGIKISTNPNIERERPTGKFILPSGRVVERKDIAVCTRFVRYGPEDLSYLLYARIVRLHSEPVFYQVDDANFGLRSSFSGYDYGP